MTPLQSQVGYSLRAFTTAEGVLCGLALDHRDAMRNAFRRVGVESVTEATMIDVKRRIVEALAESASAMMLDPPASALRPPGVGLFVPLEAQGHDALDGGRLTNLTEDFDVAAAAVLGAEGCKLLLYYRADHLATAPLQRDLLREVALECHRHRLALVVEPLVYRLQNESETAYASAFPQHVIAAARDLATSGANLLKVQFPGDAAACEQVSEAASPLGWVLLGGGDIDGGAFAEQLLTACRGGASGFMAGRAIWGGALGLADDAQSGWLRQQARPLFDRLAGIAHTHARRIG